MVQVFDSRTWMTKSGHMCLASLGASLYIRHPYLRKDSLREI